MGIRLGVIDTISAEHSRDGTMPSEVSSTGADNDREPAIEELKRELAEAREQQAAAAEILRVISSSPRDLQRVLSEIAASAGRLCDAYDVVIHQVDGDFLRLVAHNGPIPVPDRLPLTREIVGGRAVLDRQLIQVTDLQAEIDEYPENSDLARRLGYCAILAVPLSRAGNAIGVIAIRRTKVRPFSDEQIALLKTFADQAVVAIENTRLFQAEQARSHELAERTRALTEALEHQTATSEVLNVISRSPNELQPVLDAIAAKGRELCRAKTSTVFNFDGELIHVAAVDGTSTEAVEALRHIYPMPPSKGGTTARAILKRDVIYIPDIREDSEYDHHALAAATGYLSSLAVPMLQGDRPVGAITVTAAEPAAFSPSGLISHYLFVIE
jgi:two-component system, NtrC family, sensor kinase